MPGRCHYAKNLESVHVYIDGESHFIRSEQCVKDVMGESVTLKDVAERMAKRWDEEKKPEVSPPIIVEPRCKFYWDPVGFDKSPKVYFTSCTGNDDLLHTLRVFVRGQSFEPQIIKERNDLSKQRAHMFGNGGIIEKPKGVDIALSVRMLEDAHRNVFSACALFSSDVDFLPVIEAVQRMGKAVQVYGYRSGIGKNSPLEYVPEHFVDLGADFTHELSELAVSGY
jgi:uncharacterized LabA/DUF88 family protein